MLLFPGSSDPLLSLAIEAPKEVYGQILEVVGKMLDIQLYPLTKDQIRTLHYGMTSFYRA